MIGKAACSAYLDPRGFDIDAILWPELRDCQTLVVANKRHNDALYFSRIDVVQLSAFLERLGYPAPLAALARNERARLDHTARDADGKRDLGIPEPDELRR